MSADPIPLELQRLEDEYARRTRVIGPSPIADYWFHEPMNAIWEILGPLTGRSILDIGCGIGSRLAAFREMGAARLAGIELTADRCAAARQSLTDAELIHGSAHVLPWPDGSFDIVSQFVVFTSILDSSLKVRIAREMLRVLKPSGVIVWHDFRVNNPRNRHVRGIGKREIRALFPGCQIDLQSMMLVPPLARFLIPRLPVVASSLEKVPFLRSHYLGLIRPMQNKDSEVGTDQPFQPCFVGRRITTYSATSC